MLFEPLETRHLLAAVTVTANDSTAQEPFYDEQDLSELNLAAVEFTRDGSTSGSLCVVVEQHEDSTLSPQDWYLSSRTDPELVTGCSGYSGYVGIEIPDGESSVTIYVIADHDAAYEPTENLALSIVDTESYDADPDEYAEVNILDNTQTVSVTAASPAYEAGPVSKAFTFTRGNYLSGHDDNELDFNFTITGTAESGDYFLTGFGVIPANELTATITLTPEADEDTDNETVILTLDDNFGDAFKPGTPAAATIVIIDADANLPAQVLEPCPTICSSAGWSSAPSLGAPPSRAWSMKPVRYFDGTVLVSSTDLSTNGGGVPWGITRDWTNAPGYAQQNTIGEGMVMSQRPSLIQAAGTATLAIIANGHTVYYFDQSVSDYIARGFVKDTLVYDSGNDEYILTSETGQQQRFHGFSSSLPASQQGQLKTFYDAGENEVNLIYESGTGRLSEMQRLSTVGSNDITESFLYSYVSGGANDGLIASILHRRQVESDPWTKIRKVAYAYYDGTEAHGNARDLKTAAIKEIVMQGETEIENTIDTTYYRYYTEEDILDEEENTIGYVHGLKYVFFPASYARLLAAEGSEANAQAAIDDDVKAYADHYFEYGDEQRATKEIAQGAGCSSCTGGQAPSPSPTTTAATTLAMSMATTVGP